MQKVTLGIFIAIFAISLSSCSTKSGNQASETGTPPPQPKTPASPPPPAQPQANEPEKVASVTQPTGGPPISGLLQPTNPDRRRPTIVRAIDRGRQDPFALFALKPQITVKPQPKAVQEKLPLALPSAYRPFGSRAIPQPPQPVLARGVVVTGVVQVDGVIQAIIKAPNENFSRYVQPGQYIANGQVLVKEIIMNQGATPFVVLEQLGIKMKVVKKVGEQPPTTVAEMPTDSTAALLSNSSSETAELSANSPPVMPTASLPDTLPPPPPPSKSAF